MLADFSTAPISAQLRATLTFVEKLTGHPESMTAADARSVLEAGVQERALVRAVYICAMLNVMNRLSETLHFEIPSPEMLARRARKSVERLRRAGKITD